MGFVECRDRGNRLIGDMRRRWLERRQAQLEPRLRADRQIDGQGQTTINAQQANQQRLHQAQNRDAIFERYLTDIDQRANNGGADVVSRFSQRLNDWTPPDQASFENSFVRQPAANAYRQREILIVADRNFNDRGIGIPNSEVLYLQFRDAGLGGCRVEVLKRQHIVNAETILVTAESFLRSGVNPNLSTQRIVHRRDGGGDMFAALLGTPNGRAAAYLVIDHGEEMGIINIDRIEHYKQDDEEHMYIYFTSDFD